MSKDTQQAALQNYLNALLADIEPELEPQIEPAVVAKPVALLDKPEVSSILPDVALLSR